MTDAEARALVATALDDAQVHGVWADGYGDRFRAGAVDPPLAALELDSLATMEVCIAVEAHTGLELVPERLSRFATLGELARFVARGRR